MNPYIDYIENSLQPVYSPSEAKELAFWIVEESTGMTRAEILACKDTKNISNIEIFIQRLQKKEPIQYIFGHTRWMGLDFHVTTDTLIPRPETAELVEWIIKSIPSEHCSVLDIGTGSGCIAIALKKSHPKWKVDAMDFSERALKIAQENATGNQTEIEFFKDDILSPTHSNLQKFHYDCIVSNPPYICESEKKGMDDNVLNYEPHTALFVPDNNPFIFYKKIAELKLGKLLFFEINEAFGKEIATILEETGYENISITKDMYGKERFVFGRIAE